MKKKRSFKKKFLGIMLSALLVSLPFAASKPEKVKADDCYTHTNYYLFLNYRWIDTTTAPDVRQTSSVFSSELPDGAKLDTISSPQWIPLSSDGNGGWSYSKFLTYYSSWSGQKVVKSSNEWVYMHDQRWEESHTGELNNTATTTDMVEENFVYVPAGNHDLYVADAETLNTSRNYVSIGVKRTYGPAWATFASGHQNKHSFEPAVLKVTFDVCPNGSGSGGGSQPSGDQWQYTVEFRDQDTGEKIPSSIMDTYTSAIRDWGDSTEFNCGQGLFDLSSDGYTSVSNTLTLTKSNNVGVCYYTKGSGGQTSSGKTCEVTYVDESNVKISNPVFNGTSLFNPNTLNKACIDVSSYDELCPGELTSNGKIYSRTGGKPSIDDNTTKVTCTYKTTGGNPSTGDKLIFVVWAIGLGAIAYSVYFFRKYYKNQKDV